MSDRFNHVHDLCEKCLKEWVPILGLDRWAISRDYIPKRKDDSPGTIAEISMSWEYKQAGLSFYLDATNSMTDKQIEGVVVHELCHPLVVFMRGKNHKMYKEERVVTELAEAFIRARYPNEDVNDYS
jgi:hypothetical protein